MLRVGFEYFLVVGYEVGMDRKAVILGAIGLNEFLAVSLVEAAFEGGAEVTVWLAVLIVVDVATVYEVGDGNPTSFSIFQFYHKAH